MKDAVWHFVDKSEWPVGPWTEEPDKMQFTDVGTGYPCLIVRNHSGSLCGYVGVGPTHPNFHCHYDYIDNDVEVHGGLTFAGACQPNKEHGICHIVEPGEEDNVWWFGFDCAHCFDVCPAPPMSTIRMGWGPPTPEYRTIDYVKVEIGKLAIQLKERAK